MREVFAEELKQIQLEILKDVAAYCEEHGICYVLKYGTLLGAVRHKGYIPWDDDIDIAMPRPDYDRFVKEYGRGFYKVLEYSKDKKYPYAFAKVVDTRTALHEPSQIKYPMGIYIDIFPVDGVPADLQERAVFLKKANRLAHMANLKKVSFDYPVDWKHRLIHIAVKTLMLPISNRRLVAWQVKHTTKYPFDTSERAGVMTIRHTYSDGSSKRTCFEKRMDVEFEGCMFKAPEEYDTYLTDMYGNYMQLPPDSKRVSHHCFKAYIE